MSALLLLLTATLHAQQRKNIESKIDKVTVFREGAQVERSAKLSLAAGKQELVFSGISPGLDKQSIQVKSGDNLVIVSVIHQADHLREQAKQEEIRDLDTKLEAMGEKMEQQKNTIAVFKQEEAMLLKNQQVGGSNTGMKTADLKEAADFQRARLTEVYQKIAEHERILKQLTRSNAALAKQYGELSSRSGSATSNVIVTISCKSAITADFTLSYMVRKAGWFPTYDIRVKDILSPVNLQFKANVFQASGEDWKEVRLALSSGNPTADNNIPELEPWHLRYLTTGEQAIMMRGVPGAATGMAANTGRIVDTDGRPLQGATVSLKGTSIATTTDVNGLFRLPPIAAGNTLQVSSVGFETKELPASNGYSSVTLQQSANELNEVVVIGYGTRKDGDPDNGWYERGVSFKKAKKTTSVDVTTNYQPTSVVYDIADPYTVLNDGKTYMVDIDGYEIDAKYEYFAAPKLQPFAYLTARILDWQDLNLMDGEASLFFEGTFLGKSMLMPGSTGDTLSLSLGQDKGVAIKRTMVKEFSSKKFIGSNRTDTRLYEISVRNNKQQPILITVEDQLPISTLKEIEIRNREYKGASLDEDTQKISWAISLDPKKEEKKSFSYEVRYPKERNLQLD